MCQVGRPFARMTLRRRPTRVDDPVAAKKLSDRMTATSHDVQHAVEQLAGLKLHNGAGPSTSGGSRSGGGGTSAISTAGHTVNWDEVTALAQTCADSLKSGVCPVRDAVRAYLVLIVRPWPFMET